MALPLQLQFPVQRDARLEVRAVAQNVEAYRFVFQNRRGFQQRFHALHPPDIPREHKLRVRGRFAFGQIGKHVVGKLRQVVIFRRFNAVYGS